MTAERHQQFVLAKLVRQAWYDGWVAAWSVVTGVGLILGLWSEPQWVLGAIFGAQIGLVGGYFVTLQRNYRRTKREDLEFQLDQLRKLELRGIARGDEELVDHIRQGQETLRKVLDGTLR